jgi:hypothetical protein
MKEKILNDTVLLYDYNKFIKILQGNSRVYIIDVDT